MTIPTWALPLLVTVLDRANTARRWRINGALKAQEQL